ncbi:MAG: protein CpxP [Polaribacter sp.]|jgi:protein CpxP
MKNIASILVFVFAFTFGTQAQKKRDYRSAKLTIEQQTSLKVKQMTLALDLSDEQKKQLQSLLLAATTNKKAFMEKRKKARKAKKRPTSDEIYAMKSQLLDNQIAMKRSMKSILNPTQFQRFENMQKKRTIKGKKRMQRKIEEKVKNTRRNVEK